MPTRRDPWAPPQPAAANALARAAAAPCPHPRRRRGRAPAPPPPPPPAAAAAPARARARPHTCGWAAGPSSSPACGTGGTGWSQCLGPPECPSRTPCRGWGCRRGFRVQARPSGLRLRRALVARLQAAPRARPPIKHSTVCICRGLGLPPGTGRRSHCPSTALRVPSVLCSTPSTPAIQGLGPAASLTAACCHMLGCTPLAGKAAHK
jgi:hypothetical protein